VADPAGQVHWYETGPSIANDESPSTTLLPRQSRVSADRHVNKAALIPQHARQDKPLSFIELHVFDLRQLTVFAR